MIFLDSFLNSLEVLIGLIVLSTTTMFFAFFILCKKLDNKIKEVCKELLERNNEETLRIIKRQIKNYKEIKEFKEFIKKQKSKK